MTRTRTDRAATAAAVAALGAGLALIAMTFALSLFRDAPAGERITDRFRSTLTDQGLNDLQSNFRTTGAMGNELLTKMLPDLQRQRHMSDAEFDAYLKQTAPAVLTARSNLPGAVALVTPVVPQLEGVRTDFHEVDELPLAGLPLTVIPWLLLGAGALLIALGAAALKRPSRATIGLLAVAGALLIVVPLAIGLFGKVDSAEHVDRVGKVALSQKAATTARQTTQTVDDVVKQVPALGVDLDRYPAVARGAQEWLTIAPGAFNLAKVQAASVPDYDKLHDLPFGTLPWLVIIPGIVLLGVAGVALTGAPASRRL
jgi:hypothetical protein